LSRGAIVIADGTVIVDAEIVAGVTVDVAIAVAGIEIVEIARGVRSRVSMLRLPMQGRRLSRSSCRVSRCRSIAAAMRRLMPRSQRRRV
jgi:hypothetical protein